MKAIELTPDQMKELIKHLPEDLKEKLFNAIKPDSGIEILKSFVEDYDDSDTMDHIVAHTLTSIFKKMNLAAKKMIEERRKSGEKARISTLEMGYITVECLKTEAKHIREALEEHESNCDKGDDCGAKH